MNEPVEQLDTKERILDAAERLFAEEGFEAASLRSITSAAGVNLAAVNYHFHTKQALAGAVFSRRIGPVNRRRLELLEAYLHKAGDGPLSLERVLHTLIAPAFWLRRDLGESGAHFVQLMGRMFSEPGEHMLGILKQQFGAVAGHYIAALRRALPGVADVDLAWGMHFTIGVLAHTMTGERHLEIYSLGACDSSDMDALIDRLVKYTAAGLRSQVAPPKTKRSRNGER